MTVLLDLEWTCDTSKHLTQLSAVRVDDAWNITAVFNALVNPGDFLLVPKYALPFGGYDISEFFSGMTEKECIQKLESWLLSDDEIWVWAKSNMDYLAALWYQNAKQLCPNVVSLAGSVRESIEWDCASLSPYGILSVFGEPTPEPEHRASNDTEVLRRLLEVLQIPRERLVEKDFARLSLRPPQKEINRRRVENSNYNYIYLKEAKTFHRRNCPLWQNAADENDICGSVYYKTASRYRAPCKFCKPLPQTFDLSTEQQPNGNRNQSQTDAESGPAQSKTASLKKQSPQEIVHVRLLTGEWIDLKQGKIVGWCHNTIHPGTINKHICKEHDCLGKKCFYFEQSPLSFYIASLEMEKHKKEKRKREREKQNAKTDRLMTLQKNWQKYIDGIGSDMQIVRIEKTSENEYRIFYVSDRRFADGNRYPDFIHMLKKANPQSKIILRHIRDVDGHFVTRNEYRFRKLK